MPNYSRQIILPEFGELGQKKLFNAKILIIGVGGLGCPVLQYLVAAGVGKITIIDSDVVSESNLNRQILYSHTDIGNLKVNIAAQRALALNPECIIYPIFDKFSMENALSIVKNCDLVIDCSDNFPTRYLINDVCVILGKPFIMASIFKFEGQVSVFNYKNGATYRCLFPSIPINKLIPSCNEMGVLGTLTGILGSIQANEAIKIITEIGTVLSNKLLIFNSLENSFHTIPIQKSKNFVAITSLAEYEMDFCQSKPDKNIRSADLAKISDFQLLDVREQYEYKIQNLGGLNIPLSELESRISEISVSKPVVIHCQSGIRSLKAIELLEQKYGFQNLLNLENPF
jgi:adenylyltransferase/sulfurtransferase